MVVLADPDRVSLWTEFMQTSSASRDIFGALTKADIRAAINAADVWADTNAASYNTALPQPARNALTARQKAMILMLVIRRRWEVS